MLWTLWHNNRHHGYNKNCAFPVCFAVANIMTNQKEIYVKRYNLASYSPLGCIDTTFTSLNNTLNPLSLHLHTQSYHNYEKIVSGKPD